MAPPLLLDPATLWGKLIERGHQALTDGALQPLVTEQAVVEQAGLRFLVRVLAGLARKDQARRKQHHGTGHQGGEFNPFLPYDPALFVTDISPTHVGLLNKFNVVDHHLLIVTRNFVDQETPLELDDFRALAACLAGIDGLGFYNSGSEAGASQRHRHLQLLPLPLDSKGPPLPLEPALAGAVFQAEVGRSPRLPFRHGLVRLHLTGQDLEQDAESVLQGYRRLLLEMGDLGRDNGGRPTPYNLLVTRRWLLLAPRRRECFEALSVNALGFAGALLAREWAQVERIRTAGPLTVLQEVGFPMGS